MTSLSASFWKGNIVFKAFTMSVDVSRLSGDDSSSSSESSSSSDDLQEFLNNSLEVHEIQGYQYQPRRDSYNSESSESEGNHDTSDSEESAPVRLGNLDW